MIGIVDYGVGNIRAFANIYKRLGIPAAMAKTARDLDQAERIILPGVGSFDWAMRRLGESGMKESLDVAVVEQQKPVLGICVGMQMMARRSDEGKLPGLGWIDAEIKSLNDSDRKSPRRVPHMGWNNVCSAGGSKLFSGLEAGAMFYFLHSYYFLPGDSANMLAETDYHGVFTSSVHKNHIFGVQFHPEKSHQWGIQLLKNFAEL